MKFSGSPLGALLLDNAAASSDERLAALGRQRMYGVTLTPAAVASEYSIGEVNNPSSNSKTLYFVGGDAWVATSMGLTIRLDGTTITPTGAPVPLYDGGSASNVHVGVGNAAAGAGTMIWSAYTISSNSQAFLPPGFWLALPPGHFVQVVANAVDIPFSVNVQWIELSS
jgi:hypothetical protein